MVGEISAQTFLNFFIYLLVPFIFGYAAKKLKISPLIGYILGGIVIGNFLGGLVSQQLINNFAYFGIVLLLFTVGLEVNLEKLTTLKKFIISGGVLQMLFTTVASGVLAVFFGFDLLQAFLLGLAFVSSSTSIVAKIIQDRGEESSFVGEIALGILMFQDLAFIPFIIIIASLGTGIISVPQITKTIAISILEASLILWLMYYFGRKIIPKIFNSIAKTSRELLNLFIIIFIFLVAITASTLGIPILIGAFIAGVLVSQTAEHYHIFSQIRPLRDLMAIIFFVFIGTHVKLDQIVFSLPQIFAFSALISFSKALIILLIFLYFRFSTRLAFSLSLFLFQVSENAFILLSVAFSNKILSQQQYLFAISSALLTLMITPLAIGNKDSIYLRIREFFKRFMPQIELFIKHRLDFDQSPLDALDIKNHVVICGYGRVGWHVGRALTLANIPFIAIDYNFNTVEKAKQEGVNIIYGDPTDVDVLDFAQCEEALVLVTAVPAKVEQESIILNAKKLNPEIFIISRVHNDKDQKRMKDLGANSVVQPELEASISIIKRIFFLKKVPKEEIANLVKTLKIVQPFS